MPATTTYTVRPGDWLSQIVLDHYGADLRADPVRWRLVWTAVARRNGFADPDRIFPGQVLDLPPLTTLLGDPRPHLIEPDPAAVPDDPGRVAIANAATLGRLELPVPAGVRVVSGYGPRGAVGPYPPHFHAGVDLAGAGYAGHRQVAGVAGEILHAGDAGDGYGYSVVLDQAGVDLVWLFAHLERVLVEVGQQVTPETPLGVIGSSGVSTGTHLHLGMAGRALWAGRWPYGLERDPATELELVALDAGRRAA